MKLAQAKKVATQLLKEFGVPLILSIAWTWFSQRGETFAIKNWLSIFGPSFFLISWMTGQIFRVKKQAGIESNFEKLEARLEDLVSQAEGQTREMINHVTGGDSYCSVITHYTFTGNFHWIIIFRGAYNLYNVTMRITDEDRMRTCIQRTGSFETTDFVTVLQLGDCVPGFMESAEGPSFEFQGLSTRSLNIRTSARNGDTFQQVRLMKLGDDWITADRIMKGTTVLYEYVPKEFPLSEDGSYDWDQNDA